MHKPTDSSRSPARQPVHVTGTSKRSYKWPGIDDSQLAFGEEALEKIRILSQAVGHKWHCQKMPLAFDKAMDGCNGGEEEGLASMPHLSR